MRIKYGVIFVVIGVIIFLCCLEGWGADWTVYQRHDDTWFYYDSQSIKKVSDGVLRVWQKKVDVSVHPKPPEVKDQNGLSPTMSWDYTLTLTEVDCVQGKIRALSFTKYDMGGSVVSAHESPDAPWYFIVPESVNETLFKTVCQKE